MINGVWRKFLDMIAGRRFRYVSHRIITVVSVVVTTSLLALILFYTWSHNENIRSNNERSMRNVTESVSISLQTVMLAGYADIAQIFADRLKDTQGVVDFRILRVDGNEAFHDNTTIDDVNRRRGEETFEPRTETKVIPVLPPDHQGLRTAVDERRILPLYEGEGEEKSLTFLAPILNGEKCHKCHGQAKPVRGVLKLTTSLKMVEADIRRSWMQAVFILVLAVTAILAVTAGLVRRSVVQPIITLSNAMADVSKGELEMAVPVLGHDELGAMAHSFNHMTGELRRSLEGFVTEHDKLTTIILSADEGMVVTDPKGKVVLVNPAGERILGKPAERIIAEGIGSVFDNPEQMQTWLARPGGTKDEMIEFNDRILSVSATTVHSDDDVRTGTTVLIRDVTEIKRMEEWLRNRSLIDGLTGLGNRRFLDNALAREMERAAVQGDLLSILIFDIDHFKKFNDTYGHDQGDRVLKEVAECLRSTLRAADIPCRYGGEEFLVILRFADRTGAFTIADRIRQNIQAMVLSGLPTVTVSVGVAFYHDFRPGNPVAFVEHADRALYTAKRSGRNRVIVAVPEANENGNDASLVSVSSAGEVS
ncbi:MAG: diguanylate cyclase [Alphaproteobacteria bacterium]